MVDILRKDMLQICIALSILTSKDSNISFRVIRLENRKFKKFKNDRFLYNFQGELKLEKIILRFVT